MTVIVRPQGDGVRTSATSLRTRWNRGFAVLFLVVAVGGVATFAGTGALVTTIRETSVKNEKEAGLLARLRADILPHAVMVTGADFGAVPALEASIRRSFAAGIALSGTAAERRTLQEAADRWEVMVTAVGPLDQPASAEQRGMVIGSSVPEVSVLLDRAGEASRAAHRAQLAHDATVQRMGMVGLAALALLVSGLTLRFARRFSTEVLRPMGLLRDSANHLAAGELDHRVELDRADELGDLAASFNAMADAIAGSQRTLSRQANHDSLTGLANRAAFHARLEATLSRPERRAGSQAVLFVDLDDFKDVNDTLGHAAGDDLLSVVASRLTDVVRPGDLVARLGGDEFALLLDGVPDRAVALQVADRAVALLAMPVEVAGTWVHVGASIGLAMRQEGSDPESLMREADVAMYSAKGRGKNRVETYDAELHEALVETHALRNDLADAAARGQLVLHYQPIVDLADGTFVGVEALVRWQHPTRGLLPPVEFIALAEKTGAIVGIGAWVLETAARQVDGWQRRYDLPGLRLSVNASVCELDDPGFADHVAATLRRTHLKPASLVIEVTESVLADAAGGAAGSLEALRGMGVAIALDDFGTGYSSIGYLRQLPVDILKIDRSFVSGDNANRSGDVLLEAIVGLAERLGLDTIPEGIEEPEQLHRLQALGCRTGQGFLLARPVPAAAIDELLTNPTSALPVGSQPARAIARVI
jgi:diguanylate cyclase (GGDEF)-like protein